MKSFLRTHLAGFILIIVTASGFGAGTPEPQALNVVVSIAPLMNWVQQIAQKKAHVTVLVPAQTSPHVFQPKPSQIKAVADANLFVFLGGGLEDPWAKKIFQAGANSKCVILELNKTINEESLPQNPHTWVSPLKSADLVAALTGALVKLSPPNSKYFQANSQQFQEELIALHTRAKNQFEDINNRKVIAARPAFDYLIFDLNLDLAGTLAGPHGHFPSPKHLHEIITKINNENIPVVLTMIQETPNLIKAISEETSAHIVKMDVFGTAGESYVALMEKNLNSLLMGFNPS